MSGSDLAFRNLDASPDDAVETWPAEAIGVALECGVLSDWRRVAAAVPADPWGRVARVVEEVASRGELYDIWRTSQPLGQID